MNGFRDEELITVQGRTFPVIGGRLRLIHEGNAKLSIRTDLVTFELNLHAVVRATVETEKGTYSATGVATVGRDPRLADALLELAETRAVARALRFASYGVETCGVEELGDDLPANHGAVNGQERPLRMVAGGKVAAAPHHAPSGTNIQPDPKEPGRQSGNGNGGRGMTVATAAQLRAIRTLARQVGTSPERVCQQQYGHGRVEGLTVREASGLIDKLKTDAGQPVA